MPKIVLMNVGTVHALGQDLHSQHPLSRSAWRHAWFAEPGDVLVTPTLLDPAFLDYIGETLGFDAGSVSVLDCGRLVTDDVLRSPDFVGRLRETIAGRDGWMLMPCFWTAGVAAVTVALGLGQGGRGGLYFMEQQGTILFNRKSHFRQIAAGAKLPLPTGVVVQDRAELAGAIEELLPKTGTIIVKQDDAAGGMGNITVTTGPTTPLPGSRDTWKAEAGAEALASQLWAELAAPGGAVLVVECYHLATHRFYVEYWIGEDGYPAFQNSGTIRLRPDDNPTARELVWVGLTIPAELPAQAVGDAFTEAARFAALAGQIGHRGAINLDAIRTDKGRILFNEANGRWGGGLVLHRIGERLLGRGYADSHILSSARDLPPLPLAEHLQLLKRVGLAFDKRSGEGVIVLAPDPLQASSTECLLIGWSGAAVAEMEQNLRRVSANAGSAD
jgi:hypothetical protein